MLVLVNQNFLGDEGRGRVRIEAALNTKTRLRGRSRYGAAKARKQESMISRIGWPVTVISYELLELRWAMLADRGAINRDSISLLRPRTLNFGR